MSREEDELFDETRPSRRVPTPPVSGTRTSAGAGDFGATRPTGLPTTLDEPRWRRAPIAVGDVVGGRYRVDALLGRGGMGAVFAATHTLTRRRVALKVLYAQAGREGEATRRLEHEARAAGAVRHRNVVDVIDLVDRADGGRALVMELCVGESLQRRLERAGRLPVGEACALFREVVAALRAVHAAGVVHRDLKPDNVLVARGERGEATVKLLDFGIARLPSGDEPANAFAGDPVGTPWYMAPEQALDDADVDGRADIWALGVLMYQTIAGRLPTRGKSLVQTLLALFTAPIQPIEEVAPGVPADLARTIAAMLTVARDDRLADLDAVDAVLARHADATLSAPARAAAAAQLPCEHGCRRCTRASDGCGFDRRAG